MSKHVIVFDPSILLTFKHFITLSHLSLSHEVTGMIGHILSNTWRFGFRSQAFNFVQKKPLTCTKFHPRLTTLTVCTKFPQKRYFQSKTEKVSTTIQICILKLV